MPLYDYFCDDCKHEEEVFQHMVDDPDTICPECGSDTWHRVIGAPMLIQVHGSGGTTTIGALADKNAARMSDEEKKHLNEKHKTKKKVPHKLPDGMQREEYTPSDKQWPGQTESTTKVSQMTPEQQKNYMETGDKDG